MASITVKAIVNDDHQLTITLPNDIPTGPVEVQITPLPAASPIAPGAELTREQARAILLEAGLLSTTRYAPPGVVRLTAEEEEELGRLPEGAPDTSTLVAEGRAERWD